jgi:ketosteroid isomerase-like protein
MASLPARDIIQEGFKRLSDRDFDAWVEVFAEDVRLHDLPDLPDARVYEGHDGIRHWAESTSELSREWNWRFVGILAEDGDDVVSEAILEGLAITSDVPIRMPVFHAFEFDDDKIASVRAYASRAQALEAAGLEDPDA